MPIKSIIIDKETKATRIDTDKVQLELTAFPMDEENNREPSADFRLYINDRLLQNLTSDAKGAIKETIIIDNRERTSLSIRLEAIITWIQSKVECVLDGTKKELNPEEKKQLEENLHIITKKRVKLEWEIKQMKEEEKTHEEKIKSSQDIIDKIEEDIKDIEHDLDINKEKTKRNNENNNDPEKQKKRQEELDIKGYELWIKYHEWYIKKYEQWIEKAEAEIKKMKISIPLEEKRKENYNLQKEELIIEFSYCQDEKEEKKIKEDIEFYINAINESQKRTKELDKLIRENGRQIADYKDRIESNQEEIERYKKLINKDKENEKNTKRIDEKERHIAQIKINPKKIMELPERARNEREIVKYALEQDGNLLGYVSQNLQNDKKTVTIALWQTPDAFKCISEFLKTDEEFVVECLKKYWTLIMRYISLYVLNRPIVKKEMTSILDELKRTEEEVKKIRDGLPENYIKKWDVQGIYSDINREIRTINSIYNNEETYGCFYCNISLMRRAKKMLEEFSKEKKQTTIETPKTTTIQQEVPKQEIPTKKEVPVKTEKELKIEEYEKKMKKIENLKKKIYEITDEINELQDQIKHPWTWFFGKTREERREKPIKIEKIRKLINEAERLGKEYEIKWSGFIGTREHGRFEGRKDIEKDRMNLRNELKKIDPNRRPNRRKE